MTGTPVILSVPPAVGIGDAGSKGLPHVGQGRVGHGEYLIVVHWSSSPLFGDARFHLLICTFRGAAGPLVKVMSPRNAVIARCRCTPTVPGEMPSTCAVVSVSRSRSSRKATTWRCLVTLQGHFPAAPAPP